MLMLALQMLFAGVAAAGPAPQGGMLGAVCASQGVSDDAGPASPGTAAHHSGACCILHDIVAVGPDAATSATSTIVFPDTVVRLSAMTDAPRARGDPQSAPQSPRAPPPARG